MSRINLISLASLVLVAFAGCGDDAKTPDTPGTPKDTAAAVQPASQIPDSVLRERMATGSVDTSDGTLMLTGAGAESGTWKFNDVTATASERTLAGSTQALLTLEAHNGAEDRHFRMRLRGDVGAIKPGTYQYKGVEKAEPVRLEVRFESAGKTYNSTVGGSGKVELSRFDDRAAGTFSFIIPPLSTNGGDSVRLEGSFDQRVK